MSTKITVTVNENSDGRPENLDGIRFQFSPDASNDDLVNAASAYVWSAEDYDDEEHAYCEDIELFNQAFRVLEVQRESENDYATFVIEVDIEELQIAQQAWKDAYVG